MKNYTTETSIKLIIGSGIILVLSAIGTPFAALMTFVVVWAIFSFFPSSICNIGTVEQPTPQTMRDKPRETYIGVGPRIREAIQEHIRDLDKSCHLPSWELVEIENRALAKCETHYTSVTALLAGLRRDMVSERPIDYRSGQTENVRLAEALQTHRLRHNSRRETRRVGDDSTLSDTALVVGAMLVMDDDFDDRSNTASANHVTDRHTQSYGSDRSDSYSDSSSSSSSSSSDSGGSSGSD